VAGVGPNAEDHAERVAQSGGVELDPVAAHHPYLLQPLQALGDGGRGEADPAAEFREAQPGVVCERGEEALVKVVEQGAVTISTILPSLRRHWTAFTFE